MDAPVLSKSQIKNSLRKGKKSKKSVRNILSKPSTLPWPQISEKYASDFIIKLEETLTYKKPNYKVKWSLLKDIPRNDRKEARIRLSGIENAAPKPEFYNDIVFGINEVFKNVEKNCIMAVIISADTNPSNIAKATWQTCVNNRIPAIAVPNLQSKLENIIGFNSMAIGIKLIDQTSPLYKIYKSVYELSIKIGAFSEVTSINVENKKIEENCYNNQKSNEASKDMDTSEIDNVYLKRTSNTYRHFVPLLSKTIASQTSGWQSDFIQFSDSTDKDESSNQQKTVQPMKPYESFMPVSNTNKMDYSDDNSNDSSTKALLESIDNEIKCREKHTNFTSLNQRSKNLKNKIKDAKKKKKNKNKNKIAFSLYKPVDMKKIQGNPNRKKK